MEVPALRSDGMPGSTLSEQAGDTSMPTSRARAVEHEEEKSSEPLSAFLKL